MRRTTPFTQILCFSLLGLFQPAVGPVTASPLWDELDNPDLDSQRRNEIIRAQQDKWDMEDSSDIPETHEKAKAAVDLTGMLPVYCLSFDPAYAQKLRLGSLTLEVPPGAFHGPEVEVQALVLSKPADFALAGVSLEYRENSQQVILESDGMFRLRFFQNGKPVEPSKPLTVKMRPGNYESMNMYRLDGSWQNLGATGMVTDWPDGCNSWTNTGPRLILVESPLDCEGEYPSVRIYNALNRSGWWNFDKPADNITCIAGVFRPPGEQFQVRLEAVGMDYLGLSHATRKGHRFAINVAANRTVKVYALVTDRRTRSVYVGSLEPVRTNSRTSFIREGDLENGTQQACQEVGELTLKKESVELLTNRKLFLQSIGLPDTGL